MIAPFWLHQVAKVLLLPPMLPLLVAFAGLAIAERRPRAGRAIALVALVALTLLAMPAVGDFLTRTLDDSLPLDPSRAKDAQAIVVLGGGVRRFAAEYGGATVSTITLQRVRYGAHLARATGLPVLVSGGALRGAPPEALLMRDVLTIEYGVPVRWVETHSRNTHENAVDSAAMLERSGISRVILVGNSFDFPRTRIEFERQGIKVIAAPIGIPPAVPTEIGDFLPSAAGLQISYYAIYEMLANALLWLSPNHASAANAG